MTLIERTLRGEKATERLAAELAHSLRAPTVLLLEGDLGAGKTTFVRGFVHALPQGRGVAVQSPTYALARTYPTTPAVHHLDLYRMQSEHALDELGLWDLLDDPSSFVLVEWPTVVRARVQDAVVVTLTGGGGTRSVRVEVPASRERT